MKISIIGYSGSGKSTLAKELSEIFNCNCLYLDTVQYCKNWVERDKEEGNAIVAKFISENNNWIIDGTYSKKFCFETRMEQADKIVFMNFPRVVCLYNAIKRYIKNKNKTRESMAEGCIEKLDMEFLLWLICKGRKKSTRKKFQNICNTYSHKIVILKNRKDVKRFLKNLNDIL